MYPGYFQAFTRGNHKSPGTPGLVQLGLLVDMPTQQVGNTNDESTACLFSGVTRKLLK